MAPARIGPSYTEVRRNPTYLAVAPVLLLLTSCMLVGPDYAPALAPTYINWRKSSIYGGSNEIQRNIIAKMVLGL